MPFLGHGHWLVFLGEAEILSGEYRKIHKKE